MFGVAPMKNPGAGNRRFAVWALVLVTIWMALRISGLLRISPVHFPPWAGYLVTFGILAAPPILTCAEALHWAIRLLAVAGFLVCAFVFPWFYEQFHIFYSVAVVLLLYVEAYWFIPFYLKRHRSSGRYT